MFCYIKGKVDCSLKIHLPSPQVKEIVMRDESLSAQIAYYRSIKGITQLQMAKMLGVSKMTYKTDEHRKPFVITPDIKERYLKIFEILDIKDKVKFDKYEELIYNNNQVEILNKLVEEIGIPINKIAVDLDIRLHLMRKYLSGETTIYKSDYYNMLKYRDKLKNTERKG